MAALLHKPGNRVIEQYIGRDALLVPVPRSAPVPKDALWPSMVICGRLHAHKFGSQIVPMVERRRAIPKSSSVGSNRPSLADQIDSLAVREAADLPPSKIALVDDVLTMGTTTAACAVRLREAFPQSEIVVFCSVRTQGLIPDIAKLVDVSQGFIRWSDGDTYPSRVD